MRYDKEKHRDIEDRVKEIDPSLRTDTLYISIIQRETDSAWSDKGGHHSSAVWLWQQHDGDEWTGQLSQLRSMLLEKWYIYLPHNFFQSWSTPSVPVLNYPSLPSHMRFFLSDIKQSKISNVNPRFVASFYPRDFRSTVAINSVVFIKSYRWKSKTKIWKGIGCLWASA